MFSEYVAFHESLVLKSLSSCLQINRDSELNLGSKLGGDASMYLPRAKMNAPVT